MKGLKLLFAAMLAPLVFQAATADDATDTVRAATRRDTTTTVSTTRQKSANTTTSKKATASRTNPPATSEPISRKRDTTPVRTTKTRNSNSVPDTKSVSARTTTRILPRTIKTTERSVSRTRAATAPSRTATRNTANNIRTSNLMRARTSTSMARTASTPTTSATYDTMLNRDFSKCRSVFYDCMDEFCANKDSQLKRCACSSRINEFNSSKKNLAQVEEKLLDFSQRLLTVNMEKEDAAALNQATEGELAFAEKDSSKSKKMLDEIAKKLNTSFDDSHFDQNLNAISLSLNIDAAFDTVDSLAGASTTAKSGTDLYSAALPVCREMALEVCSIDDLAIAESSYQMAIEQDCNTVHKSYQTQADQARKQVFESSALLDISRLDIHQKRNSDDILTCKKKMLTMLSDSTVCGDKLGKCLDITGRYIDPTTGTAFLTTELANLGTLISRPESGQTWTTAPGNDRFITFLNNKKKFLAPAMEQCQDISDYVWDSFIEDALSQIKLAQESKLEDMRQSCTTLTTQCLDKTADSIADFDARALSIFGVAADRTVNAMCNDIRTACTAILNTSGGGTDWQSGMTEIATEKTYETIMQTCREVGRACIIQKCTSITGNFGLCENIDTSINRKTIINRSACWDEVVACVSSAGPDALAKIREQHQLSTATNSFYETIYKTTPELRIVTNDSADPSDCMEEDSNCIYDICDQQCEDKTTEECYTCRLSERIWGNCEVQPSTELGKYEKGHNKIKVPTTDNTDTLLAWFAKNTGTMDMVDNCRDTTCGPGFVLTSKGCVDQSNIDSTGNVCLAKHKFSISKTLSNCCSPEDGHSRDAYDNCCRGSNTKQIEEENKTYFGTSSLKTKGEAGSGICLPPTTDSTIKLHFITEYTENDLTYNVICFGEIDTGSQPEEGDKEAGYPNGKKIKCNGKILVIDTDGMYHKLPTDASDPAAAYFQSEAGPICQYDNTNETWVSCDNKNEQNPCNISNIENWSIRYTGDICAETRVDTE